MPRANRHYIPGCVRHITHPLTTLMLNKTIRDVTENCRTLRFDSFGFEEE